MGERARASGVLTVDSVAEFSSGFVVFVMAIKGRASVWQWLQQLLMVFSDGDGGDDGDDGDVCVCVCVCACVRVCMRACVCTSSHSPMHSRPSNSSHKAEYTFTL